MSNTRNPKAVKFVQEMRKRGRKSDICPENFASKASNPTTPAQNVNYHKGYASPRRRAPKE